MAEIPLNEILAALHKISYDQSRLDKVYAILKKKHPTMTLEEVFLEVEDVLHDYVRPKELTPPRRTEKSPTKFKYDFLLPPPAQRPSRIPRLSRPTALRPTALRPTALRPQPAPALRPSRIPKLSRPSVPPGSGMPLGYTDKLSSRSPSRSSPSPEPGPSGSSLFGIPRLSRPSRIPELSRPSVPPGSGMPLGYTDKLSSRSPSRSSPSPEPGPSGSSLFGMQLRFAGSLRTRRNAVDSRSPVVIDSDSDRSPVLIDSDSDSDL